MQKNTAKTQKQLLTENADLRARLEEAEETLRAIHCGEVDALIVSGAGGDQVFTLTSADYPYRMLVEEMNEGALTLTLDGVILYSNRCFAEMIKTPLEQVISSSIHTWIKPGGQNILQALLQQDGSQPLQRGEVSLLASDGTSVPGLLSIKVLQSKELQSYFSMIVTDLTAQKRNEAIAISEKLGQESLTESRIAGRALLSVIEDLKQAEESLRETNEYLDNLFNYANAPIIVWDIQFKITRFNNAFETLTGRIASEVIGKELQILFPPAQIMSSMELIKKTLTGEHWEVVEIDIQHADGSIRTVLWNSATLYNADGKTPLATIAQGQDITERKRAEHSVFESEQRFHHTMNNMEEGVLLLGYDWTYQYINKAAEIQGGRPAAELLGRTVMECWPGIEATDFFKLEQKVMQDRIPVEVEDLYTLLDGRERWFSWHIQPAEEGLLIVTMDITERKQIEADISQLNAELEKRVEERTRALKNAQEQLLRQERLATLGQLAGSVGHELRNPLGVISNAVYFLKMSLPDASDKVRQYLDIIDKETRISNKIVTDLLDFTRIKSLSREPVSIPALVSSVLIRYPAPASDPGYNQDHPISVIVNIPDNLPKAFADPRQMEQVLGNLVVNAFQAMQVGGKLTISAAIQSDMIIIEVQDTGTGILPENMGKLFEPLFTTKTAGIGLGLAVSKKLAEANGGRIEVTSEVNKGSLFRLVLPIHNSDVAPASSTPEISGAGRGDANALPGAANPPQLPTRQDEESK